MPQLIKSRVYVTFPGSGEAEVFPLLEKGESIRFGWVRDNDIWRKDISTKLGFANKVGHAVFDIFAAAELEECGCHVFPMRITLTCDGVETTLYEGSLFFIDGEWYFDRCYVEIKPRVEDPFTCLFQNWETEKNIMSIVEDITLATDSGNFEVVTCSDEYNDVFPQTPPGVYTYETGCLSGYPGGNWLVLSHELDDTGEGQIIVTTEWIRETFVGAGPPAGDGWTQESALFWTRPAVLSGPTYEQFANNNGVIYFWKEIFHNESTNLDNGRNLSSVFEFLFEDCPYPLRSDFLGINADGTAPVNAAYVYAQAWLHSIIVYSMSDVVNNNASENATIVNIKLKEWWECFRKWLKLFMFFDADNSCYRIEHITYKNFNKIQNLVSKRPDAIRGYNTYTYEKSRIPEKDEFEWSIFKTNDVDWDGASIIYPACNDRGNIVNNSIECFHTDFANLVGTKMEDLDLLKGTVLVTQHDGLIDRVIGDVSGLYKLNGALSWANIVRNIWRWEMPSCTGIVNGVETTFLSLVAKIKQKTFNSEMCCNDILQLNPATDLVRTGLGNGEFDGIEIDLNSGMGEYSLLHRPPLILEQSIEELTLTIQITDDTPCWWQLGNEVSIVEQGTFPFGTVFLWDFGVGAVPATANTEGPHFVEWHSGGVKTITVTATYNGVTLTDTHTVTVATAGCSGNVTGFVKEFETGGIFGVNVRLYNDANADGISDGGAPVKSVFTAVTGSYSMVGVNPGNYVIEMSAIPNYDFLIAKDITPDGDLAPDITTLDMVIPTTVRPSVIDNGNEFTFTHQPGTVHGIVLKNAGLAVAGATVNILSDADLDGVPDSMTPVASAVTDSLGRYFIYGLANGEYLIQLIEPSGLFIVSGQDDSPDGDNPADLDPNDVYIPLTMEAGKVDLDNNYQLTVTPP